MARIKAALVYIRNLGLMFIFSLILVEIVLAVTDVYGAHTYLNQGQQIVANLVQTPWGRGFNTGIHRFPGWQMEVDEQNRRVVPDTNPAAACRVVVVGDSLTMGQGVNDEDIWVNLLARNFPDMHFINSGISGRTAADALLAIETLPADAYIYLVVENDAEPGHAEIDPAFRPRYLFAMEVYFYIILQFPEQRRDVEGFIQTMEAITAKQNVLTFTFEGMDYNEHFVDAPNVHIIPWYEASISRTDLHPNEEGHRNIAAGMLPIAQHWLPTRCPAD